MTDGADRMDPDAAHAFFDDAVDVDLFAHASRAPTTPTTPPPFLPDLAEWLPRLGPVLWVQRCNVGMDRQANAQPTSTLLLDHPALTVLSACRQLRAHQATTARGPREWLSFQSVNDASDAKLFVLPDTNVLAWDEMSAALRMTPSTTDLEKAPTHATFLGRALSRFGQRWQARLLEFRCMDRPWLRVLDARSPLRISLLGIEIARNIVRDEYAEWISPMHLA